MNLNVVSESSKGIPPVTGHSLWRVLGNLAQMMPPSCLSEMETNESLGASMA